jgi:hypothetical protein
MDTKAFLERVLPVSGGQYFAGVTYPSGRYQQMAPLGTVDELLDLIDQRKRQKQNVFFATGVYDGQRTIAGARYKKALYVDLDTTGTHQGFTHKKGAVLALKQFCAATKFPFPNILVDSGNGIHGYWTFSEPVTAADWQEMADALKQLCSDHGLQVDEAITADCARIMRVPGTFNYKDPSKPMACRVLLAQPGDFDVQVLRNALSLEAATIGGTASALLTGADNDDLGGGMAHTERVYHANTMVLNCAVLKHSLDTGGKDQAGVLWHKILHLLAFTQDGQDYIHAVSDAHDEYSRERTERRFAYSLQQRAKGVGPTLCKTFAQFYPAKCAGCPFNGKVKTPLILGKAEESYLPPGYKMTDDGIFKATGFNEARQAEDWLLVFPYKVSDVEMLAVGHELILKFTLTGGPIVRTLTAPVVMFTGEIKELQHMMMSSHVYVTDHQVKEFKQVMIPWMRKMSMVKDATKASVTGLGWSKIDGKVSFATATTVYIEDGSVQTTTGLDKQLLHDYQPKGDPALWQDAAQALIADKCNPVVAGVLSAFAAPLINFTGVSGVMFSLCSPESGTGKSSALRVAQAVWGNPLRGVNSLNDTALSVAKKMGFLNSLPAYWDELRMREEVQGLVKMVFQLGQGKERSRLNSSAKHQEMGTWSTMITVATNEPVLDHIDHVTGNTNAGRLRVFEVDVPHRPMMDNTLPLKLKALDENHGYIADLYAEFLAKNHAALKTMTMKMQQQVSKELRTTNDQRFWVAAVSTILLAAMLVNKKGWLKVDTVSLKAWLYDEFTKQADALQGTFKTTDNRAFDALRQFCDEMRDSMVVCDHLTSRAQKSPGVVHVQPMKSEIIGVIALKDKRIRVKRSSLNQWIYTKMKDSPRVIVGSLLAQGAVETKGSVTAGLANTLDSRVTTIEVDTTHAALQGVAE